ncbi:MAG TPA: hypothetical protein EYQ20_12735 [candidate division Zixibacteria bacterium]|nr:hypothetical protein [candidate division Zixibacteria bacterium]
MDLYIRYGSQSAISEGVRSEIMAPCFFDGGNGDSGTARVGSGIYLYRIVSGTGYVDTKRMTLLK